MEKEERVCAAPGCDNTFVVGPRQHVKRYCSTACRRRAQSSRPPLGPQKRVCKQCGKEFVAKRRGQVFCSAACRYNSTLTGWSTRRCRTCGNLFQTSPEHKFYCSDRCMPAKSRQQRNQRRGERPDYGKFQCPQCGKVVDRVRRNQSTCGDPGCIIQSQYVPKNPDEPSPEERAAMGLPAEKPGNVRCLKCDHEFWSRDKRRYRICPDCNKRNGEIAATQYLPGEHRAELRALPDKHFDW